MHEGLRKPNRISPGPPRDRPNSFSRKKTFKVGKTAKTAKPATLNIPEYLEYLKRMFIVIDRQRCIENVPICGILLCDRYSIIVSFEKYRSIDTNARSRSIGKC